MQQNQCVDSTYSHYTKAHFNPVLSALHNQLKDLKNKFMWRNNSEGQIVPAPAHFILCILYNENIPRAYLGVEAPAYFGGIILAVTSHIATADVLDRDVLNVEPNIVTWQSFR